MLDCFDWKLCVFDKAVKIVQTVNLLYGHSDYISQFYDLQQWNRGTNT